MKKKKTLLSVIAVVVMVALAAGLIPNMGQKDLLEGRAYAQVSNQWNPSVDTSRSGEVIPDQYIVQKKNGDIELVKTKKGIKSLKEDKDITAVEPNRVVTALAGEPSAASISDPGNQEIADMQYGDKMVRAPEAWNLLPEDTATVRVAVIDTGIDATHPDLSERVVEGTTIIEATSSGNRYTDDGKDDHGHGTHVAGVIAATWNNGVGIDGVTGKTNIELMPVKVLNDAGRGSTYDIIEGIRYAADHGASILNLSLGSGASSALEAEAVRYAQNKGCLVIAAAGNDAIDVSNNWPASYDGVISVGSVDAQGVRSYFSNYGATLDVAAPGSDIISCIPKKIALQEAAQGSPVYGNDKDGYYISWSGTSMATPHAAGVAALYKAANPGAAGSDIGDLLIQTCQDVGDIGKDLETGSGIVDAAAMMGAEMVKTPLRIKSPAAGTEVYEEVVLTAQVNPTMDIKSLKFYLDEEKEENIIGQADCDENNSFYEIVWDTKKNKDGDHTLLAAVYDSKGSRVGETETVKINILNHITNGFTMQVMDPYQNKGEKASYYIYGIAENGSWKRIKGGITSQLGYSRVKGLGDTYSNYLAVITGKCTYQGKNGVYVYQHSLTSEDLGSTITISGENTNTGKVTYTAKDENGNSFTKHYLSLSLKNGSDKLSDLPPMTMNSDTELYLSEGGYYAEAYQAAEEDGTAYLLHGDWEITDLQKNAVLDAKDATKIKAEFTSGAEGVMELTGKNPQDKIPFMAGSIRGKVLYISPGAEYTAVGELTAQKDDRQWKLTMEKKESVIPKGSSMSISFKPDIKVREFTLKGARQDQEGAYYYVGDALTSENNFGDENGDVILNAVQTYPTLRIYQIKDGKRQLIYQKTDRGNSASCYWNSRTDYNGKVPPAAGDYVAELSYDAGPFGGETVKEQPFQLRTRSGAEEMTCTVTMDGVYKMSRARINLYSWDEKAGEWQNANTKTYNEAGEDGVIRNIPLNSIQLGGSGIHAAVLTLNGKKDGYQLPTNYTGFAVVPFRTLDELEEIDLSSEDMKPMSVRITDQYGNLKSGKVYFPAASDGGKLAEKQIITDIELTASTSSMDKIYIPKGEYAYAYSRFNDSAANYFLTESAFNTDTSNSVTLDGSRTKSLTLNIADDLKNSSASLKLKGAEKAVRISTAVGNIIHMTPEEYTLSLNAYSADEAYAYTIQRDASLDLQEDTVWKIGASFTPDIQLKQKTVAADQILLGNMKFRDGNGNSLTQVKKDQDGFYEAVYPDVLVGAEGVGERSFSLQKEDGYQSFSIDPGYYYGEGPHYMMVRYDLGSGSQKNVPKDFVVGLDYEPRLTPVEGDLFETQQVKDGEVKITAKSGTKGYLPAVVRLNTSSRERDIVFTQYRDGKKLQTVQVKGVFASKVNNNLSASFNIRPGDEIDITAK